MILSGVRLGVASLLLCSTLSGCADDEPGCEGQHSKIRNCGLSFAEGVCAVPEGRCVVHCWSTLSCGDLQAAHDGNYEDPSLNRCLTACQEKFSCDDGTVIPEWWRCDTFKDCADGSDEPEECIYFSCNDDSLARPEAECDGWEECPDGSDEWNCEDEE